MTVAVTRTSASVIGGGTSAVATFVAALRAGYLDGLG